MSHTYAIMEVSRSTYDEIHGKLIEAGYQHAIHDVDMATGNGTLDMHGIALRAVAPEAVEKPKLKHLHIDENGMDFAIQYPIVPVMAAHLADAFKDAGGVNYVTFEINHVDLGPLVLTMQRRFGETPAQQATERLNALQAIELLVTQSTDRPHATLSRIQGIVLRQLRKAAGITP